MGCRIQKRCFLPRLVWNVRWKGSFPHPHGNLLKTLEGLLKTLSMHWKNIRRFGERRYNWGCIAQNSPDFPHRSLPCEITGGC